MDDGCGIALAQGVDPTVDAIDRRGEITPGVLDAIDANKAATQQSLADKLGIALGLTNAYLKRCVHKGWIKVKHTPAKRYFCYVAPQGFAEKGRLTTQYLARSLTFFRQARAQFEELFPAAASGCRRTALVGAGGLTEISQVRAHHHSIALVAFLDPNLGATLRGVPGSPRARIWRRSRTWPSSPRCVGRNKFTAR